MALKAPHAEPFLTTLKRTCVAADRMLCESVELSFRPQNNTKRAQEAAEAAFRHLVKVPRALQLAHMSLLAAVDKVAAQAEDDVTRRAVSAIVMLFQSILGQLHSLATIKSENTPQDDRSIHQSKSRTLKHQNLATPKLDEVSGALTRVLIHFSEALDFSQISHNMIFEGLICVFLDHLGSSLSLFVFADAEAGMSKPKELGLLPPRGLVDTLGGDQGTAISTAKHEACYLVTILRHLMLRVDKQQYLIESASVPFLEVRKSFATSNGAFVARVRKMLQNTLLRGVFGDDDESFKDALRRPIANPAEGDVDIASNARGKTDEWFIGEVWSLLGWDTLTEEAAA